jgi:hypothetical protein
MQYTNSGIPILNLSEKIAALEYCMKDESSQEDAVSHLFDLLHHMCPGWKFLKFQSLAEIADYYGSDPAPILED